MPASMMRAQASRARVGQLAGVVGVQHHVGGFAFDLERADHFAGDARRLGDRHAGVDADDFDMVDGRKPRHHVLDPARRQHQRIAAGEDDLPDVGTRGDVIDRGVELFRGQWLGARTDHLAAEAEAAVDRADMRELEQHAVGIAMDDAGHGAVRVVADRIGALLGPGVQLRRIGHELPRDRIVRIAAVDQRGHRRRDGDGILRGDLLERGALLRGRKPRGFEVGQLA